MGPPGKRLRHRLGRLETQNWVYVHKRRGEPKEKCYRKKKNEGLKARTNQGGPGLKNNVPKKGGHRRSNKRKSSNIGKNWSLVREIWKKSGKKATPLLWLKKGDRRWTSLSGLQAETKYTQPSRKNETRNQVGLRA